MLTGAESYHIEGVAASLNGGGRTPRVRAVKADGTEIAFTAVVRVDTPREVEYYRNGGILPTCCDSWRCSSGGRSRAIVAHRCGRHAFQVRLVVE